MRRLLVALRRIMFHDENECRFNIFNRGVRLGLWPQRNGDLPTVKVGGMVTIDNQPLANAHVIFTPSTGRAATAQTATDGSFTLGTYRPGDGAIVGRTTM